MLLMFGFLNFVSVSIIALKFRFTQIEFDISQSAEAMYVASLYYAINTITTCGYGDLIPMTSTELLVTIFLSLVGITCYSFVYLNILRQIQKSWNSSSASLSLAKKFNIESWIMKRTYLACESHPDLIMKKILKVFEMINDFDLEEVFAYDGFFDKICYLDQVHISVGVASKFSAIFSSFSKSVREETITKLIWRAKPIL